MSALVAESRKRSATYLITSLGIHGTKTAADLLEFAVRKGTTQHRQFNYGSVQAHGGARKASKVGPKPTHIVANEEMTDNRTQP
jgi:hypothetical protein